jgi:Zn-dependent metalloprotease
MRKPAVLLLCVLVIGLGTVRGAGASVEQADGLQLIAVKHSLLGVHRWYRQTYRGYPVLGGYLGTHQDRSGRVLLRQDGRIEVTGSVATVAAVDRQEAEAAASQRTEGVRTGTWLAVLPGAAARLVWAVSLESPAGTTRVLVDARTGTVLRSVRMVREASGSGQVFNPNAVVTLQDQTLKDKRDSNYTAIQPAYRTVTLTNLDGTGYLQGSYAKITKAQNGKANEPTLSFIYDRKSDKFEQVVAYYQVTQAQLYIQSLGFTDVNNSAQKLKINTYSADNSFYDPSVDTITYGRGGVDDAEDADIIWHEYGHAIQDDQVPGYGGGHDAGSIGEGFGDYWAVTMSQPVNGGYEVPCVGDWDSVSYTSSTPHCLRRTDTNKTTADETGEVHDDGEIWSRALWDINQALGRNQANTVILEAQFSFAPNTSFAAAAQTTVNTAQSLYGSAAASSVQAAFQARGIL